MAEVKYNIFQANPENLSRFEAIYDEDLKAILESVEIPGTFIPNEDFIELSFFTLDNVRLQTIQNYKDYSFLSGDKQDGSDGNSEISIDPQADYEKFYGDNSEVKSLYHFLRDVFFTSGINSEFSIESISPDRREARLVPLQLNPFDVERFANRAKRRSVESPYNLDLHLYCDSNTFYSCINIDYREFRGTTAVLLRFAEPLPRNIQTYKTAKIVEKVSNSVAFEINVDITPDKPVIPTLRGANFNVEIDNQSTEPSEYFNYNELFSFPTTNSYRELNSLFNEKGAELGIDYGDFANFINFSSAEERLRNFRYKLQLLENYQTQLDIFNDPGFAYTGTGASGSVQYWENLVKGVINNFDHYERYLFYSSGSTAWPKANNTLPYVNLATDDTTAVTWYNTEIGDAILYDASNPDILTNTIPAYLKEDENNRPYELFVHMVAQHFDNLWLYTDAVSKKYDNDNRLNRGASKDLIEDLLKNFGVKLYTSNRSAQDLFKYFTVNSYDIVDSEPNLEPIISGSDFPVSQNDYQKEIYKRIYHNLPLLMKSKGTERGLRALINCFGIPSDILKIRIYGGRSSEDLPFFGGERAYTGSLDKVRLNNTGSIVPGDTLSQYTSIINPDNFYTQDLHNIEVGFSPTYNINSYIVSQSAVLFPNTPFDIDDYIGDPRGYETSKYLPLYAYAETVLADVETYDLKDFVRLIKFFDNVIFRMVRDFVPARSVSDTGIIIKPHLLDRSKFKSPVMSWTRPEYSGSIDTAFAQGSNAGAFRSVGFGASGSTIVYPTDNTITPDTANINYEFTGSIFTQESSTRYRELVKTPSGSKYKKWSTKRVTPSGILESNIRYDREQEQAKFDGELSGSHIQVSNGELNEDNPFKELIYKTVEYDVFYYSTVPDNICILSGKGTEEEPYILRWPTPPETPTGWSMDQFFNFASLPGHTYADGFGEAIADPSSYTFEDEFGGNNNETNYIQESFGVIKDSPAGCVATSHIMKVICDLNINQESLPPNGAVFTFIEYNLPLFFTTEYNTETILLVNNVEISNEQAEAYVFSGTDGESVEVIIRDENDQSCENIVNLILDTCALRNNPPSNSGEEVINIGGISVYASAIPPEVVSGFFGTGINFGQNQEYDLNTCILGANNDTQWFVQIKYIADLFEGTLEGGGGQVTGQQEVITDPIDLIFHPSVLLNQPSTFYNYPTFPREKIDIANRYNGADPSFNLGTTITNYEKIQAFSVIAKNSETCIVQTPFFKIRTDQTASQYKSIQFVASPVGYASVCSPMLPDGSVGNLQTFHYNSSHVPTSIQAQNNGDNNVVRRYIIEQAIVIYTTDAPIDGQKVVAPTRFISNNVTGEDNEAIARKWTRTDNYNGNWSGFGTFGVQSCGLFD